VTVTPVGEHGAGQSFGATDALTSTWKFPIPNSTNFVLVLVF